MKNRTTLLLLAAFAGMSVALAGCQQNFAYINIPADKSDMAAENKDSSNIVRLEVCALKAVRAESKVKGPVSVLLPDGTRYETYQKVVALAGEGFVLPEAAPAGTPVYEVRSIRARGSNAQVDVVTPGEIRPLALTEVNLEFRAEMEGIGWRAAYLEPRRIAPAAATHQAPKPAGPAKAEPAKEPAPTVVPASEPKTQSGQDQPVDGTFEA